MKKDAATKEYVDNTKRSGEIGAKTKGVFFVTGNIDFANTYKIENLPLPVKDDDAVTRVYVDTADENFKREVE